MQKPTHILHDKVLFRVVSIEGNRLLRPKQIIIKWTPICLCRMLQDTNDDWHKQ